MFLFANILLLALFAAVPIGFLAELRRAKTAKTALQNLWAEEKLLYCPAGEAWRCRAGLWLFCAGLAAYEISVCFCNSMARENWAWVQGVLSPLLDWVAFLCFGAKILFCTKYSWRSLGVAGCLYFIARWVYFNSQNIWWIGIVVAVMAAKDLALQKPMRAYLYSGLAAVSLVVALHFAGIVSPDLVNDRAGQLRGTYGYGHPNTFGGLLFGLALAFALLHAAKPKLWHCGIVFSAGVFLLVGPASRTAGLCCLLLGVLLAVCVLRRGKKSLLPKLAIPAACLVALTAAASYLPPLLLVKNGPWDNSFAPAWLSRIDNLLTSRISLIWYAYRLLSIKIAGQVLTGYPSVDNSFAFSLYQFGPVVAVLLAVLLAAALYGMARSDRKIEFCCLLVLLVYSFMEMQVFHLTSNPAALLLCGAMYALPLAKWPPAVEPSDTDNA